MKKKKLNVLSLMDKYITFYSLMLVLCSCSGNKITVPTIELKESEDWVITLDESTVENMEYSQLIFRNDSCIFAFTNKFDNSILFYDYKTRKYIDRIKYHKEGSNGIGSVFAFYYKSNDSIYHYHYNSQYLYRTNKKGEVLEKEQLTVPFNLSPDSLFFAPILFPRTNSPLQIVGDEMLIAGFMMTEIEGENENNRPVMSYYNLKTHKLRHSDSYPAIYHKGNWGGDFTFRNPCYTLSKDKEIVLSFSADHHLRVHPLNNTDYEEYYAGVGGKHSITPFNSSASDNNISRERLIKHYAETLSYGPVLYDKYRHVYYRVAHLPKKDTEVQAPVRKPIEIIVLDEAFNIIGKSPIKEDRYWINQCFVGEEGLHIQVQSEDEDKLIFKTFTFEKMKSSFYLFIIITTLFSCSIQEGDYVTG